MNKEKFLLYFKKNKKIVDHENDNEVKITNVIKAATSDITNDELTLVAKEIQNSCSQKVKYQKAVPETIKKRSRHECKSLWDCVSYQKIFVQICRV